MTDDVVGTCMRFFQNRQESDSDGRSSTAEELVSSAGRQRGGIVEG